MTQRKLLVLCLLVLSGLCAAPSASADPVCTALTAGSASVGDVFISSVNADENFESSQSGFTGVGKHDNINYTLIHIDVSFIPAGATISSATVTLKQTGGTGLGATVDVDQILGGWNPDTVTWDDFTAGFDPNPVTTFVTGTGSVSFDLTSLTQAWVDHKVGNYGILLSEATGLMTYDFSASENLQIFNVCYTDAPSPSLSLQKTVSTTGACPGGTMATVAPGTQVTYCYGVTNTGGATVSGVVVTDDGTTVSIGDLAPGASGSGSATAVVTSTSDTGAVASGNASGTEVSSLPSDALVTVLSSSLSLQKTVSLAGTCPGTANVSVTAGLPVTYCYAVTNTGGLGVTGVVVSDAGVAIPIGDIAPGTSGSGSTTIVALSNTSSPAVASGTDSTGANVTSPQASARVTIVSASGLDPSCQSSGVYQTVNNPGFPNHENATCAGGDGLSLSDAIAFCGASVNYFDYTCTDLPGGQRSWTGSFGCCVPAGGPSCSDGIKNGTETDVDCGGQCPQACNIGQGCTHDTDCISDFCVSGKCATPSVLDSTCINDGTNTTLHDAAWPDHEDGNCDNGFEAFTIFDAAAQCPGGVVKYFDYTCTDFALPPPYQAQRAWEADYSCCQLGAPSIVLSKTVSTNGTCPGSASVTVLSGTPIVDCYTATNTGNTGVTGVVIVDDGVTLPIGDLAPGQSAGASRDETPAASEDTHAVAQGTADGVAIVSPPADAPVVVVSPALTVLKTVSTDGTCPGAPLVTVISGSTVTFCYAVTNNGDTEIDGITVTDAGVGIAIGNLGAGSSGGGSVSATVTTGSNTGASASGTVAATDTPITSNPSVATVVVVNPALVIQKTVNSGGGCPGVEQVTVLSGTRVTYCYSVTNTGDTAVAGVTVNDDGATISVGDLGPGQTGNGTSTVTALSNADTFASASGAVTATGTSVSAPPDDASVNVVTPALAISVTVSLDGTCPGHGDVVNVLAGTAVTWCYEVTNTGDTTVDTITVSDSHYGLIPGVAFDLAPGESETLELSAPANADISLLASASGTVPATGTPVVSPQEPGVINVVSPDVDIDVTVSTTGACPGMDSATVPAGTAVTYCYEVANNGDDTLSDITVTDGKGNTIGEIPSLAAGASTTLSSALVTVQGNATIAGTATGTDVYGFPVTDSDTAVLHALFASLQIQKTASLDGTCPGSELVTVLSGTQVTYCYAVTNSGGTAITGTVVDDNGAVVRVGDLAPGQTQMVLAGVTATVSTSSNATANGINAPTGEPVASPPDGATVTVVHPAVSVLKTASVDGTCPGSASVTVLTGAAVTYCYQVTDTGDTTLNDVSVSDAGVSIPVGALTPGQTIVVTEAITAPSSDVDTAAIASAVDTATWTNVTSPPSAALVHVIHPALTIATTVSTTGACPGVEKVNVLAGTGITWCYVVTNNGDAPVTGLTVTDDHGGNVVATGVTLAAGSSITLSRHDAATVDLTLTATAAGVDALIGSPVKSNPDAASVNVVSPTIRINVTISTNGTCPGQDSVTVSSGTGSSGSGYCGYQYGGCGGGHCHSAGSTLLACYQVTNAGDDTLDNVVVTDQSGAVLSTDAALASGASYSFSKALAPVTADTSITGTAKATDVYGFPVTNTDTALIHVLKANLAIVKTAPAKVTATTSSGYGGGGCGGGGQQGGTAIAYTLTITNIGQATAEDPVVTDVMPSGSTATSYSAPWSTSCGARGSTLTCTLADLAPGASTTITLDTVTSVQNGTVTNTASVTSSTPDTDLSNNSSTASTVVQTPRPTRTCSYYASHPNLTQQCLAALGGEINLGWFSLRDEKHEDEIDCACVGKGGDKDHRVETGISMVMGVLNCSNDHYTTSQKRVALEQTKMAAAKELVAALCNAQFLGATPSFDIDGMKAAMNGNDASAIQQYTSQANAFNGCGTTIDLPVNAGQAMGSAWDDPTDCND